MIHEIKEKSKEYFKKALEMLKNPNKRIIAATIAKEYGHGGDSFVAKEFNISRDTIRKGKHELRTGIRCADAFNARGRKKVEELLPNLLNDIKVIVDSQSQTDPKFDSERLYTRLTIMIFLNKSSKVFLLLSVPFG